MMRFVCLALLFIASPVMGGEDALDAVNALRAQRGLRPFIKDEGLTAGAINVADFRAARQIRAHSGNDFAGLPVGCFARAAGCAANHPSYGWMACCTFESWTYAGAAWTMGSDGRLYCHLFVR